MRKGWVWVALLLSVGVNIGVLATLGVSRARMKARWERPQEADRMQRFERLAHHLELEGEAREQFMRIQRSLFQHTLQHRESLHGLRAELQGELMSDSPDREKVGRLLDEIGATHRDLNRALVENVLATREILTPEQQQRYLRVVERMRNGTRRPGDRIGPRGSGRRPPVPNRP